MTVHSGQPIFSKPAAGSKVSNAYMAMSTKEEKPEKVHQYGDMNVSGVFTVQQPNC